MISKTASVSTAPLSSTITYTVTARNAAAYPGLVRVTDALPTGLQYVAGSNTGGAQYFPVSNTLQWNGQLGVAGYTLNSTTNANVWDDISGAGTPTGLGDEDNELLQLSFPIVYYGDVYTQTALVSNGYLRMYHGTPPANYVDPNITVKPLGETNPDNIIAPLWADLDPTPRQLTPTVDPTIFYHTLGIAPNRRFIVQWNNVPFYGETAPNTFQIVLHETSNQIQFVYQTMSERGARATIGLEDSLGQRVEQYSLGVNSISNNQVLTWNPTDAEQHSFSFRATVVAPAQVGDTLVNTASVQFGAETRQSNARVQISPTSTSDFMLYLPLVQK